MSAPEQTTEPPIDEYERAIWYGFTPDDLADADTDSTAVTWAQYCKMLGSMMTAYDESKLPEWEGMTQAAPDTEIKRDGAMVTLLFAAKALNMASFNAEPPAAFGEYAPRVWDCVTMDYPVFEWDTPIDLGEGCSDNNHVGPAYDFCLRRVSVQSGKSLLEFDGNGDLRLEQPLTLREAALSVLRLYESNISYTLDRIPIAEDTALIAEVDARRDAIFHSETDAAYTGTAYYVSNNGNDDNDGLMPETAWATLDKVNIAKGHGILQSGDAVFLERGGLWRGHIDCVSGVAYSAYGEGEKPKIYGSSENGTGAEKWTLWYDEGGVKIWQFYRDTTEVGNIVLNGGDSYALRVYAFFNGESWVVAKDDPRPFDVVENLTSDMQFYSTFAIDAALYQRYAEEAKDWGGIVYAEMIDTTGPLYLRCDQGNPGELYSDIEFHQMPLDRPGYVGLVNPCGDNLIDNLCIRYSLCNGIAMYGEGREALGCGGNTIQNCEVG